MRTKEKEQPFVKHNGISLMCKPETCLPYNNTIMLLPCLASCEQFSETSNNSGLVRNAFKKKTTEHCKKRWILTYWSTFANKCTGKQFTSIRHLLSAHMGCGMGGRTIQAYKTLYSCLCKVHTATKTVWTCAEWWLDVQGEVCFFLYWRVSWIF